MIRNRIRLMATALCAGAALALLPSGPASAAAPDYHTCFNKGGYFLPGSLIRFADWDRDGNTDECFGIAPNYTIWHVWRTSDRWYEMPNHGSADAVSAVFVDRNGRRAVQVFVLTDFTNPWWCSRIGNGITTWSKWSPCAYDEP